MTRNYSGVEKTPYTRRWRKARKAFLAASPLCRFCLEEGRVSAANVVDHIVPHNGDMALFWDTSNWQPLCKECHDSAKHIQEMKGIRPGATTDGMPVDKSHHWYKADGKETTTN